MNTHSLLLLAIASAAAWTISCSAAPDVVTVDVDAGQIAGNVSDGVRTFKGIPFAAPPIGELRWRPPQPVTKWTGVRAADAFADECMQQPFPSNSAYARPTLPTSEDCLYLNVWTAGSNGDKRPVMVWIHGGAWTRGSGATDSYDGAALAKKGVVVVTTNYRLGVFGFLSHPELTAESTGRASGNYGILDHVAALQWVQRNIAAFGGDPGRVTIFGESAGAWSVNVVQASPLAKGLFHRAIAQSGGLFAEMPSLAEAEQAGVAFAKSAGADNLNALRAVSAAALLKISSFRTRVNVDGHVLPDTVRAIFSQKRHTGVPVLLGSNADEWTTFTDPSRFPTTIAAYRQRVEKEYGASIRDYDAAYPVEVEADIAKALLAVGRDATFTLEMRTWARFATNAEHKAFLYQFTRVPPGPNPAWGAYHAAEIVYAFNNVGKRPWATDVDRRLADQMSSYWVNFASAGDPNGVGLAAWPAYGQTDEPYLELGDTARVKQHLLKPQLDFLEGLQNTSGGPQATAVIGR